MRWILPLLSLALAPSAFAEIAVYTGMMSVQNVSTPGSSVVRVAEVIDLSTGNIITIGLTGGRTDYSYAVGPEVPYVVARTSDGRGHGTTAFAQASTDTDSAGSKFAMAANLRGRDMTVNLSEAGSSQWPRTLTGTGSLVAAAGTNAATTPASASFSMLSLALSEPYSKLANASGGTLSQAAEVVAQQYRNRIAAALHYTPVNNSSVIAGGATTTAGIIKAGTGTLLFGGSNTFTGAVTLNGGTLRLNNPGTAVGSTATITGETLLLNGAPPSTGGVTTVGSGSLTVTGTTPVSGAILNTSGATLTIDRVNFNPVLAGAINGATAVNLDSVAGGTLTLNNSLNYTGSTNLTTVLTGVTRIGAVTGASNLTLNGSNLVNASGAVLGTVAVNASGVRTLTLNNANPATLDPAALGLISGSSLTLTKTGNGTLVLMQPNGTALTVTGTTTIPITTTPAAPGPVAPADPAVDP